VGELVAAFSRLAENSDFRAQLGNAGRARAEQVFSAQRMAAEFHATYDRIARAPLERLGWVAAVRKSGVYLNLLKRSSQTIPA
jgi:hypothetical protein